MKYMLLLRLLTVGPHSEPGVRYTRLAVAASGCGTKSLRTHFSNALDGAQNLPPLTSNALERIARATMTTRRGSPGACTQSQATPQYAPTTKRQRNGDLANTCKTRAA